MRKKDEPVMNKMVFMKVRIARRPADESASQFFAAQRSQYVIPTAKKGRLATQYLAVIDSEAVAQMNVIV